MSFSDYLENVTLDHILGGSDFPRPATVYVAVYTVAPTDAGGGTEATGGSYARIAVTNNSTNFPAAASGSKTNGTELVFPTATASWGTIVAMGLFDAATGGNLLVHASLASSTPVGTGDTPRFGVGVFTQSIN